MNKPQIRFKGFEDEHRKAKIRDILSIGNGCDYKHLQPGDIPVFGTGGLMTSVNQYLYDGESVFIGRKGTIDKPMYYNGKFWTVDTLFYTHSFKKSLPLYVFPLFQNIDWYLYNAATGVPSLSKETILDIDVTVSESLEEQKYIGTFFKQIDEMIAEAEREVSRLEKMKQASLQKMFPRPGASAPEIRFDGFTEPWQSYRLCDICTYRSSSLKVSDANKSGRYVLYDANNPIGFINSEPIRSEYVSIIKDGAGVGRCRLLPHNTFIIGTLGAIIPKENCHIDFLFNVIGNLRLGEKISGSTIPHIYFSEYGLSPVLAPSFSEQRVIGEYFRNLDLLLSAKRQKLVKLRNIKQACLDKMFVNTSDL